MVINLIKYPNNIVKTTNKKVKSYGNRGMTLESEINSTNEYYLLHDIAVVHKKPTPVVVVKQVNQKIVDAYFKVASTTDYNGIYKGKYIDFDAKETKSKTSFPLSNIHNHQIKHIESVIRHKGIGFIILRFTTLNETYLLFGEDLLDFINNNDRKSIPYEYFKERGHLIKDTLQPQVDYLKVIEKYGGIKNEEES
jgi:recombination protein U